MKLEPLLIKYQERGTEAYCTDPFAAKVAEDLVMAASFVNSLNVNSRQPFYAGT